MITQIMENSRKILIYIMLAYSYFANASDLVYQIEIDGAIGPATSEYVSRGIEIAHKEQAKLIILSIDTPGGLDTAMRDIIQAILISDIPIVSYVSPSGARAASAGTYILYASHVAVMSPGTNLGAATPVSMMPEVGGEKQDGKKGHTSESTLMKKVKNDSKAYIRSLAELHNRNVAWAEKAVTEADSISAQLALKRRVIDFIAEDIYAVAAKANGKVVKIKGKKHKISVQQPVFKKYIIDFKTSFLLTITNPSIAYMLFLAGIYGLFFEFTNPGLIIPGVLGGIALIVALYAMNSLPISYAGLTLLVLGVMFIVAELYVTSYGILGVGGIIALILGSLFLYDANAEAFHLAYSIIIGMVGINIVILAGVLYLAVKAYKQQIVTGVDSLIKRTGVALSEIDKKGLVKVNGEIWNARSDNIINKGQEVEIVKVKRLLLTVKLKE